jgi:FtsH-binding integral membrane protein
MTEALQQALDDPRAAGLGITVETARTIAKYTIMVMGVLSVASLVLGVFVLRRHRPARVALTILGLLVALATLLAGPPGWAVSVYVAASVVMLWSKPARVWFSDSEPSAFAPPPAPPPPPPQ